MFIIFKFADVTRKFIALKFKLALELHKDLLILGYTRVKSAAGVKFSSSDSYVCNRSVGYGDSHFETTLSQQI